MKKTKLKHINIKTKDSLQNIDNFQHFQKLKVEDVECIKEEDGDSFEAVGEITTATPGPQRLNGKGNKPVTSKFKKTKLKHINIKTKDSMQDIDTFKLFK